jgi:predicted ATPase/DNA-binding SARP family transcriptional activator
MPDSDASSLMIRLFGPFEVRRNGVPLPRPRTRKAHWLLALLTLRSGAEVERSWLAGMLWPDRPEPQAQNSLRNSLADLRGVLGPEANRLQSPSLRTLSLDLSDAEVDVVAFDAAIAQGDPASWERAAALYRGPLLEGCTEEWAFQERSQREQAYLKLLEALATHALEGGDPAAAERRLRLATAVDPLRETAQRALMQALAAGGNYAGALQTYRELRLLLHRELNAEPDPQTQALFQQIRAEARGKAAMGVNGVARTRGALTSTPVAERSEGSEATSSLELFADNLPAQLTRFIGREQEMVEVKRLLSRTRLLTLTGAGGCGKTRLALQVAADLVEEYADGVWLVELAALADPVLAPQTVASALGVREQPGRPLSQTLVDHLKPRSLLLVLDNCEHLLAACAHLAEGLLRGCPNLRILATSREGLGLVGEQTYRVPSLSLPDPEHLPPLERLPDFESVRLCVDRAVLSQPAFVLTAANAAAVAQICARLDGIPLAIELAAARVKALPVETIAERLDDRFRLLTGGSRTALPRQQTLRGLIDWSYNLLTESERRLLLRLSVFAAGWTLEAAEAVCSVGQLRTTNDQPGEEGLVGRSSFVVGRDEVLDLLTSLVEKSLVIYEEQEEGGRYRLLETIRAYARERLEASGEATAIRRRHAGHFLALAEQAEPELYGPDQGAWLDRLEREHANLWAALGWLAASGEAEECLRLAGALARFWMVRGYWSAGREWLERALASTETVERSPRAGADGAPPRERAGALARARALHGAGVLAAEQGDARTARAFLEESLAIQRVLGNRQGIATGLYGLGNLLHYQEEFGAARALFEEALTIQRELADRAGIAATLQSLGNLALRDSEPATARACFEESLAIRQELGDRASIAHALGSLAELAQNQSDYETARVFLEESLATQRALGNRLPMAGSLCGLGNVARDRGDHQAARALYEESLAILRELGDRRDIAWVLNCLADVNLYQGDYAAAHSLYDESLSIERELDLQQGIAFSLQGLGLIARDQGEYRTAQALLEESLAIRRGGEHRLGIAASLHALGEVARDQGQDEAASTLFAECLAIRRAMGDDRGIAWSLHGLGTVACHWGDDSTAQALLEESLAIFRRLGFQRGIAASLQGMGDVASAQGDAERAGNLYEESLALLWESQEKPGIAGGLEGLARVLAASAGNSLGGEWDRAVRLLGAADALRAAIGTPRAPAAGAAYQRLVDTLRAGLGEETFTAAWAAGRTMPLNEAVAYALEPGRHGKAGAPRGEHDEQE